MNSKLKITILFFAFFLTISTGCTDTNDNANENALNIALNDKNLMDSVGENYSINSVDKCTQKWAYQGKEYSDEYTCVIFSVNEPKKEAIITAYVDVDKGIVNYVDNYPLKSPMPINTSI